MSKFFESMSEYVDVDKLIDVIRNISMFIIKKVHLTYGPIPLKTFLNTNESIERKFKYETKSY